MVKDLKHRFKEIRWWGDKDEWGRRYGTNEAEITNIKIFNQHRRQTKKFKCGNKIIIKAEFIVHEDIKQPHFGVAIFREDGIYCYGPNTLFDGHRIKKLNIGKGWFSIEYAELILLPGKYRLSIAIWDKEEVLAYSHRFCCDKIEITGTNRDGRLVSLPYKWKVPGGHSLIEFKNPDLSILEDKWKQKIRSKDAEITSMELLDSKGNSREFFKTGEKIEVRVRLKHKKEWLNHYIWIGIYRKDSVYCHGVSRRLIKGEKEISLTYSKVLLLTGTYYLSVGIWEADQDMPLVCHHAIYPFKVSFDGRDHGTVYLEHRWKWKLPSRQITNNNSRK